LVGELIAACGCGFDFGAELAGDGFQFGVHRVRRWRLRCLR
jgi:hypothetical protein